ncbi:MAG: hypothetical protein ACE5I3_13615 [Phycisphaerae bacterium]
MTTTQQRADLRHRVEVLYMAHHPAAASPRGCVTWLADQLWLAGSETVSRWLMRGPNARGPSRANLRAIIMLERAAGRAALNDATARHAAWMSRDR